MHWLILHTYLFKHFPANGMKNSDEALLRIWMAGQGLLVKMLMTFEPHGTFCILTHLTLSRHWYAKRFLIFTD